MTTVIQQEQRVAGAWWWGIGGGLVFAVAAIVAAPLVGIDVGGIGVDQIGGQVSWASLFAGTFLSGGFFWWLLVVRPQRLSVLRGAVAGVCAAVTAYPLVFAIAEVVRPGSVLDAPLARAIHVLEFAVFGFLVTGFGATLLMALVGVVLAVLLRSVFVRAPAAAPVGLARRLLGLAGSAAVGLVVVLSLGFIVLTLVPLDSAGLSPTADAGERPAATHDDALAAFAALEAQEATMALNPVCHSRLLTHGSKVADAVILLHGFTNCPAQYDELAPELFALGYNVYVPLLPRHGEADRMTLALAGLTAEEIVATTTDALELSRGLGEHVAIAGLSGGGTMAAWAGQYRADADQTLAIAPFLGPKVVPVWANRTAMNLLLALPNFMVSWDPREPEGTPEMNHAYPRWATHALAQFIRLGEVVGESAGRSPALAPGLGMLLNDADNAVNNAMAARLIAVWRAQGREVDEHVLPRALGLEHDLIDPRQANANTEAVYPVIIEILARKPGTQ